MGLMHTTQTRLYNTDKAFFHQEAEQHIFAPPRGSTGFLYGDLYLHRVCNIFIYTFPFFFSFCTRKQELQKKKKEKSREERRVELGEIKSMLKPHAHTTLFNLCFRSKRLSKTNSQKQPPNSESYGQTLQCSRKSLFPQKDPCSFLIAKGILFLTTLLFSLLCGC